MAYFGTNGVRGTFEELPPGLAQRIAQATGLYLAEGAARQGKKGTAKIIVARDCRLTGETYLAAVLAGLSKAGCDAIDIGIASSPTAEYMVKRLGAAGCIIISASHNPPQYNGLKAVDGNGIAISAARGLEIEKLMGRAGNGTGRATRYDNAAADHAAAIKALVDAGKIRKRRPKIIADCGNGTAVFIALPLLRDLGCDVVPLNGQPDGRFPGRPSEPTEANVKELIAAVKSSGADAGIAWDGDGDRVIFVDEKGNYVIGDRVYALSILWKAAGGKLKGDVVTTVATSRAVEDVAKKCGAKVRYTAIGAPALCEGMEGAAMGGEEVGGVIWPELGMAKDGFMTAAKLAEALCEKPLSAWLKDVPAYCNVKLKIGADAKGKKELVARVRAYAEKNRLAHVNVDGVRVNFRDSWVIVRASGTEPYVRVFAEATTEAKAQKLAKEYEKIAKG
ncbi:MAG: phosphoglucosamine mutase [Candidatus ainarchaeum sp.]|nr:phosphoglucosamine mutase [Candidatus ainarchaeum sp.]